MSTLLRLFFLNHGAPGEGKEGERGERRERREG